jgi:hypothetical protein
MKRLILIAIVVLFSALTLWAQTETAEPTVPMQESLAGQSHHHNKHHNKQHSHHPHHHSSITARR